MIRRLTLIFTLLFSLLIGSVSAQELEFKSFEFKANDAAARAHRVLDNNENPCALLRVFVAVDDVDFKGNLGIRGEVKKVRNSEFVMYIPEGSKSIQVQGEGFLPFTYHFNQEIKGLCTYELYLIVPEAGPKKHKVETNYIALEVSPQNATVLIDNMVHTLTEGKLSAELSLGRHTYQVAAPQYHSQSGEFEIVATETTSLKIELKPAFGWLDVQTTPAGATVMIDSEVKGTSPCKIKLESGNYFMQLLGEGYIAYGENISITDGVTRPVRTALKANFAQITIQAPYAHSEIWLGGKLLGKGSWTGRLNAGTYAVESRTEGYEPCKENIEVEAEVARTYPLQSPIPIYCMLKINTTPFGAEVKLDGKIVGKTPWQSNEVLAGRHTLELSQEGYETHSETITLTRDAIKSINTTLKKEVIASNPATTSSSYSNTSSSTLSATEIQSSYQLGKGYYSDKDYTKAVKYFREAAEAGYAPAQSYLGMCYQYGLGVTKDLTEAAKWYRKAADQGSLAAKNALIKMSVSDSETSNSTTGSSSYTSGSTSSNAEKTYQVGDYYNENGKEGVVFWVDGTGKHGKIVSMKESSSKLKWSSEHLSVVASSRTDGKQNLANVKRMSRWETQYPAFAWCTQLGEGWYLPAIDEMSLYLHDSNVHNVVNRTLEQKGGKKISDKGIDYGYWSSTKYDSVNAYRFWMGGGSNLASCMGYKNKTSYYYVRAVATF